ncbi:alpha/beta hydrolase [Pseudomonas aeruginosa]|uniref:alpha/beta hydrolase n=1 Tax=Pseudomonas aeruginosa TaxID=287 RepID=UPI0024962E63|nr:alpha/beta hydrolase [Pseudomonas aeruginosa]MDI2459792.1 alpha/beta hydrolase [Pseudomonas aeruginosa]HBO4702747.1 alpha/beta hydrolase [Pseudomonas aeruginosa]HCF6227744.1 alpha/beta hydrolase [Pseudomonas aeruginosa]
MSAYQHALTNRLDVAYFGRASAWSGTNERCSPGKCGGHLGADWLVRPGRFQRCGTCLPRRRLGYGRAALLPSVIAGVTRGDPAYVEDEVRLNPAPMLSVPPLVLHAGADTCDPLDSSKGREAFFTGRSERQLLDGLGHFPQRETPQLVAENILRYCQ